MTGQNCVSCKQNYMFFCHHCALHGQICYMWRQNFACPKEVYYFMEISKVKIHFFKKCSKNGLISEKNYFFPLLEGGGVQTQKWKIPLYFFIFIWTLPLQGVSKKKHFLRRCVIFNPTDVGSGIDQYKKSRKFSFYKRNNSFE